jgi:hypothetical protein
MVKKDVRNWLEEFGAEMKFYNHDYKEQMFSLTNIENSIGKPRTMIDINECYWQTIKMLPLEMKEKYITESTYISGLKKKEWKIGRNASIGALAKTTHVTRYKKGKPDYKNRPKPISSPKEYQSVRNHVIGHVYRLFFELYELIDSKFCMFLTDCIVTEFSARKTVEDFFTKHGYTFKSKPIEFLSVDRVAKRITWWDFKAEVKNKNGITTRIGREKYYQYAMHQVVDGVVTKPYQYKPIDLREQSEFIK